MKFRTVQQWRESLAFLRGNILILSLGTLLGNFSRMLVFPYASLYILALGGQAQDVGFVNAVTPFLGLFLFPIAGYIADYFGRVKIIVYSTFFNGLLILFIVFAPSWEVIAIVSVLRGFITLQFPAYSAMVADSLAPEDRGRGVGVMNVISGTLSIFAPLIAGLAVEAYGPNLGIRFLYAVMMAFYMLSALLRAIRKAYSGVPETLQSLSTPLRALAGIIILGFMVNGVASPFWVVYAVEELGLSATSWGLILMLETAARSLVFIPIGLIVDRWGRTRSLLAALFLALIFYPLFIFADHPLLLDWGLTAFSIALIIRLVASICIATTITSCTALMADLVPRETRGRVMAALGQGGVMLGAAGGGTGGPATGFMVTIPLMISSLLGGYLYSCCWYALCAIHSGQRFKK